MLKQRNLTMEYITTKFFMCVKCSHTECYDSSCSFCSREDHIADVLKDVKKSDMSEARIYNNTLEKKPVFDNAPLFI